jgi:CheY-like chemotaxis protein/anti-anti-sigma regulatory factor
MALEVRRRRVGSGDKAVEIVDVLGRLDAPGSALLRSKVQEALKEGSPRIAVNLSDCIEIHREMIGTFHSLGRACLRAGGKLVLFGQKGDIYEYLKRFADTALAPWFGSEREGIVALGGEVPPEKDEVEEGETPAVVALGSDPVFMAVFWKLSTLGGKPVAKFDNIAGGTEFLGRRPIHSVIMDTRLPAHDIARFIRQVRTSPKLRRIGIFLVGPASQVSQIRTLVEEGADRFVPLMFQGEEILARLEDRQAFFKRLKDAYDRFDARFEGGTGSNSK